MKNNVNASNESEKEENSVVDGSVDFGSVLASARKFKNYTVEQISEQLRIPARTIEALEKNDVDELPPPTFTQGYIRAYAKYLEIPEDNVLAIYNRAVPNRKDANLRSRSHLQDEANSQSPIMKTVTVMLILVGIMAMIYGIFQYYQEKADVIETALESKPPRFTGNSLNSPSAERLVIKQNARLTDDGELILVPSGNNASNAVAGSKSEIINSNAQISTNLEATLEANSSKTKSSVEQKVIPQDVLTITAEKGSWIQVRDANNSRLLYNTVPASEVKILKGRAPFRVSMGNAKTTHLTINDVEIDISEYIRDNNTAKFSVSIKQETVIFH